MISIIVDGVTTPLSAIGNLSGHEGWGMAPLHRIRQRGPLQHGDSMIDFRLDPRVGRFLFRIPETRLEAMYARREAILSHFPPDRPIIVEWDLPYGKRRIDCQYDADLSLNWDVGSWAAQKFIVSLSAEDPTYYDPTGAAITFSLGGGGGGFTVPMSVPFGVGASSIDQSIVVAYPGTWMTYPHIRITGPITDCVITNETTGEKLDFDGVTIASGDYYDIDTRYGYKSVVDAAGENKIADLAADSDLATFHLAPRRGGEAVRENAIRVQGKSSTAATRIDLVFFARYLGI